MIKDINFNFLPSNLTFRSDIARDYNAQKLRNIAEEDFLVIEPTYFKSFTWTRTYNVKYPITKALQIDFNAVNQSRIR